MVVLIWFALIFRIGLKLKSIKRTHKDLNLNVLILINDGLVQEITLYFIVRIVLSKGMFASEKL